jgi:hypothetical protein
MQWARPVMTPRPAPRDDRDPALRCGVASVSDPRPQTHPAPAAREQERRQARAWRARCVPQDQEEAPQEKYALCDPPDPEPQFVLRIFHHACLPCTVPPPLHLPPTPVTHSSPHIPTPSLSEPSGWTLGTLQPALSLQVRTPRMWFEGTCKR